MGERAQLLRGLEIGIGLCQGTLFVGLGLRLQLDLTFLLYTG